MLRFIGNLVGVKADQAVQGAVSALVAMDPKSATEAELKTMEQDLDALGRKVAEAQAAFSKEEKEYNAIQATYGQRLAAAELLQNQHDAEADPAKKAGIEASLGKMLGLLEEMQPEVEREQTEAREAKEFLDGLQGYYEEAAARLKGARANLDKAQRDMARSEQQREMAERRAESARQAAGLATASSSLGTALAAMQRKAADEDARASVANQKAKLLAPTRPEKDDANIAAAMAAVSGKGPAPTSINARLAALRQK